MTEPKDKHTIFGMPVESFGRREDNSLEDDEPLRLPERIRRCLAAPPLLGWPLTVALWVVLAEGLIDLVYTYVTGQYGIFLFGAELPPVWSFILVHLAPILRILAIFGIFRTKSWGINLYLLATVLFLLFCTVPQFELWKFLFHVIFFIALVVLLRGKWELFD
ncbi:MAG: hypothetical protein ACYDCO_23180 [Armatimonadota bacterium]